MPVGHETRLTLVDGDRFFVQGRGWMLENSCIEVEKCLERQHWAALSSKQTLQGQGYTNAEARGGK